METADKTIEKLEKELQHAKQIFDEKKIIDTLQKLFNAYHERKDHQKGIRIGKELYPLYEKMGKKSEAAKVLLIIGRSLRNTGEFLEVIEYTNKALDYYQELNDEFKIAASYSSLGAACYALGEYKEALSYLFKALEIFDNYKIQPDENEAWNYKILYAETLENIGFVYGKLDQNEKHRNYLIKALQIYEDLNIKDGIAKTIHNIGTTYSQEEPEKKMEYFNKALEIATKYNFNNMILIFKGNISKMYYSLGQYENALLMAKDILEMSKKNNYYLDISRTMNLLAWIYFKKEEYDLAIDFTKQSLKFSLQKHIRELTINNYNLLGIIYKKRKEYKAAYVYYRKYSRLKEKIINFRMLEKISVFEKKYEESNKKIIALKKHCSLISTALKNVIHMDLIGTSTKIKKVLSLAMTVAVHPDTNILIIGESGTGKEIIANIIHYASSRKDFLIVAVNSSSIPETLAESEFFGHMKGSFTGASIDKTGYLELADKGTLFLDEIADIPISLQAKLLRVLENKRIKKLGSKNELQVDFRIIAATNKNIDELIEIKQFRLDLLHRIKTITINIPPLRERREDIEPLLHYFIHEFSTSLKKPVPKINQDIISKLKKYSFPGNVRELKNMVEKALILLKTDTLEPEHFEIQKNYFQEDNITIDTFKSFNVNEIEKHTIINALNKTNYNKDEAAVLLGFSRATLFRKIKKYNISLI